MSYKSSTADGFCVSGQSNGGMGENRLSTKTRIKRRKTEKCIKSEERREKIVRDISEEMRE